MIKYVSLVISAVKDVLSKLCIVIYWYLEEVYRLFVPPPMKSIDGEVILVTGANGGIGREICKYIVKFGKNIKLVMWDLDISELNKLADELKFIEGKNNNEIFSYEVDISTRENIDIGFELVNKDCGPVTIIFNNAAIAPPGNFLQMTNEQVNKIINVNLMSHFWIIRNFLPDMVAKNHGRIVNICAIGAIWAGPYNFPYFASKYGGHGYMEALKVELALFKCDGIHCTTAYPNFLKSPLIGSLTLDKNRSLLPQALKTFLDADNVAIKIVDGVRREYEYVYVPLMITVFRFLENFLPDKLRKFVFMTHVKSFYYKNNEEQKIFDAPFKSGEAIHNEMEQRQG